MARKGRAVWCERPWSQAEEISQCGRVGGALSSQGPGTTALPVWPQLEEAPARVAKDTSDVNQGNSARGAGSAGWGGQKQVRLEKVADRRTGKQVIGLCMWGQAAVSRASKVSKAWGTKQRALS